MASIGPFKSNAQASVALTTTLTSVASALALADCGDSMLVVNACAVPVTFDIAAATLTVSATSSYVIPANSRMLIAVGSGFPLFFAAMPIGTASASVYVMRGNGNTY